MKIIDSDRLLAEVELKPVQGSRFQPTGFPSLGPAEFRLASSDENQNVDCLLVESAQSMANRLEMVCLDDSKEAMADELKGMPFIQINNEDDEFLTNSLLEAHRINSSYLLDSSDKDSFKNLLMSELKITKDDSTVDIPKFAQFLFKHDPNSILHGLFLSRKEISGGRYKLTRSLSSFIEATNVKPAVSGGVKLDHLDPKGGDAGAAGQMGHIPYSKTEYVAETIKAYFNIDLSLIRSYGLTETANEFLFTLALWKIQSFLKNGLRLRTACDLVIDGEIKVTYPKSATIPSLDSLSSDLKKLIEQCKKEKNNFEEPLVYKYKKSTKTADK